MREHLKSTTNSFQLQRERETASLQRAVNRGCKSEVAAACPMRSSTEKLCAGGIFSYVHISSSSSTALLCERPFFFNYIKGQELIKAEFRKLCCPDNDPFFVRAPNVKTQRERIQPLIFYFPSSFCSCCCQSLWHILLQTLLINSNISQEGDSSMFFIIMKTLYISSGQRTTFSLTIQPDK